MGIFCAKSAAAVLLAVLFLSAAAAAQDEPTVTASARYGRSLRGSVDGLPLLVLRGTHRERGEAHGVLAAREIIRVCDSMAGIIAQGSGAGTDGAGWEAAKDLVGRFRFPARFQEELRGMMDGVEKALPEARDRRLQATGAEITLEDLKVLQCGDVLELMQCSQFSAWGSLTLDGSTIIARNLDYPFLFPADTYCVVAVEPAEDGLQKTMDAAWFGLMWLGVTCLNEEGVYLAANDAGDEDPTRVSSPVPGALALRMAAETARADNPLAAVKENIDQKTALAILYHVVAPAGPEDQAERAFVFEHAPGATSPFEARVRRSTPALPDALVVTNDPLIGGSAGAEVCERYAHIEKALADPAAQGRVHFEKARSILDSVARSSPTTTTLYSSVIWPARREMRIAVSPAPGESATKQRYARVQWSAVFDLR
jgi:hypothetical protein